MSLPYKKKIFPETPDDLRKYIQINFNVDFPDPNAMAFKADYILYTTRETICGELMTKDLSDVFSDISLEILNKRQMNFAVQDFQKRAKAFCDIEVNSIRDELSPRITYLAEIIIDLRNWFYKNELPPPSSYNRVAHYFKAHSKPNIADVTLLLLNEFSDPSVILELDISDTEKCRRLIAIAQDLPGTHAEMERFSKLIKKVPQYSRIISRLQKKHSDSENSFFRGAMGWYDNTKYKSSGRPPKN
jgi:hypothetical protein